MKPEVPRAGNHLNQCQARGNICQAQENMRLERAGNHIKQCGERKQDNAKHAKKLFFERGKP